MISGRGVPHWIKVFFLCVVKGTEAALPADVSHSFTNASNRNFERCRVDSNMLPRITPMAPEINVEADFEGNSRIEDGKRFVFMNL